MELNGGGPNGKSGIFAVKGAPGLLQIGPDSPRYKTPESKNLVDFPVETEEWIAGRQVSGPMREKPLEEDPVVYEIVRRGTRFYLYARGKGTRVKLLPSYTSEGEAEAERVRRQERADAFQEHVRALIRSQSAA